MNGRLQISTSIEPQFDPQFMALHKDESHVDREIATLLNKDFAS